MNVEFLSSEFVGLTLTVRRCKRLFKAMDGQMSSSGRSVRKRLWNGNGSSEMDGKPNMGVDI